MVWGMRLPDSFGEFWPEGDFEYDPKAKESGWRDRLRLHYLAQSPEEQIRLYDYRGFDHGGNGVAYGAGNYPSYVSGKFRCEVGAKERPSNWPFTPVEAHEAPQTFDTERSYTALGSFIALNSGILAVDESIKLILEKLEPNVHHFFPIEIRMPKGKQTDKKYFTLVVGQFFDSFDPKCSDRGKKNFTGLAFRKDVFGNSLLWKETGVPAITCFSDNLKSEIDKAGLHIPKHYMMKEV